MKIRYLDSWMTECVTTMNFPEHFRRKITLQWHLQQLFVWKDEERTFWWFVQILIILMIDLQTPYGSQCEDFCKQLEALAKGKDQRFVFSHAAWSNPKRCVSRPVRCAGWCEVGVHLGLTVDLLYLVKDTYAPSLGYELLLKLLNS